MIRLVLSMVWTRRGQAVTLALLALFAVAAAVASPAYLAAADRAVAAGQIETASPAEKSMQVSATQNDLDPRDRGVSFAGVGPALVTLPGFAYVYSAEFNALGIEDGRRYASRVTFRQDACPHLRLVTGRCPIGVGEVLVGEQTAKRRHLVAGQQIALTFATITNDASSPGYAPAGRPGQVVIAGTYAVADPTETYWGTHGYFTAVPGLGAGEPVFTDSATLAAIDHGTTQLSIDGTAGPQALNPDNLAPLRAGLADLKLSSSQLGPGIAVDTGIPALLDRIDEGRAAAEVLVPVLAVPLVLLACLSIFLAVGYGSQGRQPELAIVALRGSRRWTRWWLATGESLAAVLAGAVAGCVAGQLLVDLVAEARFPGAGAGTAWGSLRYAPVAALAALLAAVAAQRRQLLSPVATLLRRNPAPVAGPRALATEAVVVLLAVLSGVQLVVSGGSLTGIGLLAPAFGILAVALIAARALLPSVTWYASRAVARGRLGVALAGFQLSRRPGAQRLFALLVATVAVAGYAACAIDASARDRSVQAGLGVGAERVVSVAPVPRSRLLNAVRAVDPGGDFAMAAVRLPNSTASEPIGIAVDAPRLAAVADWPGGSLPASTAGARLHPDEPAPVTFAGPDLTVTATGSSIVPGKELRLLLLLSSQGGLGDVKLDLGAVHDGPNVYREHVPACAQGCRLHGIALDSYSSIIAVQGRVVIGSLGTAAPLDPAHWRMPEYGTLAADPGGLRIDVHAPAGLPAGVWISPADTPDKLPIVYAGEGPTGTTITGLDGTATPIEPAGRVSVMPRIGLRAMMVDLEYADRDATDVSDAIGPEVWLGERAPADVLARLAAQGLSITGDTDAAQVRGRLARQGPALALWFYLLAAVLAVLLGAGALVLASAVDRRRRVEDLSALRAQGLGAAELARATLWTYPVLVAAAALIGLVTALLVWAATGWALPLSGIHPPDLPLPWWPRVWTVAAATVAVFLLLASVALVTGRDLHRRVSRQKGANA